MAMSSCTVRRDVLLALHRCTKHLFSFERTEAKMSLFFAQPAWAAVQPSDCCLAFVCMPQKTPSQICSHAGGTLQPQCYIQAQSWAPLPCFYSCIQLLPHTRCIRSSEAFRAPRMHRVSLCRSLRMQRHKVRPHRPHSPSGWLGAMGERSLRGDPSALNGLGQGPPWLNP